MVVMRDFGFLTGFQVGIDCSRQSAGGVEGDAWGDRWVGFRYFSGFSL